MILWLQGQRDCRDARATPRDQQIPIASGTGGTVWEFSPLQAGTPLWMDLSRRGPDGAPGRALPQQATGGSVSTILMRHCGTAAAARGT